MQRSELGIAAAVATNQMQRGNRHIELGAVGVFERDEFRLLAVDRNCLQAAVAADTMIDMHDRRTNAQLGEVAHRIFSNVALAFTPARLQYALAE